LKTTTLLPGQTNADRVIAFIERFCRVPEGRHVGKPLKLLPFQKAFIKAVYGGNRKVRRAYLSIARKNGKSALIACLVLAHLVGPLAVQNSQIVCGARSQKQAGIIYKLAAKMVAMSPELKRLVRATPSQKLLTGLPMNVEFGAISAEAQTAHGFSPVVAILDEVGQVKGPTDAFIEAIETSQGAYEAPLLIAISTQAPTDGDLFSQWLDDAEVSGDDTIVSHVYTAPADCALDDREAWAAANPALGEFRSLEEVQNYAADAARLPSKENSFRWLFLNQRIDASSPFISRTVWQACDGAVVTSFDGLPVFGGLDLSSVSDLTAFVAMAPVGDTWHVRPTFWLPEDGLREKSRTDRVPYDVWAKDGDLETTPGPSIDYRFVAGFLWDFCDAHDVRKIAFDRWGWRHLKPLLAEAGFSEAQLEGDAALFEPFGQGFQSMSPALLALEAKLLNGKIAHGGHPVLTMCAANATLKADPAGNRKLDKMKSHGRIDGMVALAMAEAMAGTWEGRVAPRKFQMYAFG
jgi:phage terminase large subunit-like protein